MTAIIGFIRDNIVYIGGDSCSMGDSEYHIESYKKVFEREVLFIGGQKNIKMIFGYSGSFRFGQILHYMLSIPDIKKNQDELEYLVKEFIPAFRECLKDNGLLEINNNVESGGTCLIGFMGRLFVIYSDFQVSEPELKLTSIGAGFQICLALLDFLLHNEMIMKEWTSEQIAMNALAFGARHIASVHAPFHLVSTIK